MWTRAEAENVSRRQPSRRANGDTGARATSSKRRRGCSRCAGCSGVEREQRPSVEGFKARRLAHEFVGGSKRREQQTIRVDAVFAREEYDQIQEPITIEVTRPLHLEERVIHEPVGRVEHLGSITIGEHYSRICQILMRTTKRHSVKSLPKCDVQRFPVSG